MTVPRLARWLLGLLLLLVIATAGAGWWFWQRLEEPYKGFSEAEVFVDIPQGSGARVIGKRLAEAGVVRDELTFRAALLRSGLARDLRAGEYRFDRAARVDEIINRLVQGDVYRRLLTFREGLTIAEMAQVFAASGLGTADDFVSAASDASLIRALDPEAKTLEGYLYPETYGLPRGTPAAELARLMVSHFEKAFDEELRRAAAEQGLTVRQVVTIASLVEKETARDDERPLVGAVYRNRLKMGMGMQADPTVIFALQLAGRWDGNLSRADLDFDSPYNTYKYAGLPPGPIAAPSRASLVAALHPAEVDYLYFVSRNDGSHVFATTLAEHNRNVQQWQVQFFRERRLRGQRDQHR
jgi:UPF0755 protein